MARPFREISAAAMLSERSGSAKEAFRWIKTIGGLRRSRQRELAKACGQALFCFAAYKLARMMKLPRFPPATERAAPA
jgi:hypothetical protein